MEVSILEARMRESGDAPGGPGCTGLVGDPAVASETRVSACLSDPLYSRATWLASAPGYPSYISRGEPGAMGDGPPSASACSPVSTVPPSASSSSGARSTAAKRAATFAFAFL